MSTSPTFGSSGLAARFADTYNRLSEVIFALS